MEVVGECLLFNRSKWNAHIVAFVVGNTLKEPYSVTNLVVSNMN